MFLAGQIKKGLTGTFVCLKGQGFWPLSTLLDYSSMQRLLFAMTPLENSSNLGRPCNPNIGEALVAVKPPIIIYFVIFLRPYNYVLTFTKCTRALSINIYTYVCSCSRCVQNIHLPCISKPIIIITQVIVT